jgi:putative ABC transport system permease protein
MFQDLRYGARMLLKNPGFTSIAIITFALGIGANTLVFSGVYAMLYQPLPYSNPERLAVVSQMSRQEIEFGVSYPNFTVWKERNTAFERIAASSTFDVNLTTLSGSDRVERITNGRVSPEFFPLLGGRAQLGRVFLAEEFRPGSGKVAILSHKLWQERFGADAGLIGRIIKLDDQSYTVIGVMPPSFLYPYRATLWTPLEANEEPATLQDATANHYRIIGALRPGVSFAGAAQELARLEHELSQEKPAGQPELTVKVSLLRDTLPGLTKYRMPILALQFAVIFVLLIASVNLANMLLARNTARRQEFTIRLALGASRWRLARQLLIESLLLGMIGSLFGLLLASWGLDALRKFGDMRLPGAGEIELNTPVLLVTLLVSLLISFAFGLGPALIAARQDSIKYLKPGVTALDPRRRRVRGILVAAEVALAVALLTGSGLMIRTFLNLTREDPGFNPDHAGAVSLALPQSGKDGRPAYENHASYFGEAIRRIRALPEVESVGGVSYLPLVGYNPGVDFTIAGRASSTLRADIQPVTPDYFRAIGIPLLRGRQFSEAEMKPQPDVAIVNNAFAKKFWPNEDSLGKQLLLQGDDQPRVPLVVSGDVKQFGLHTEPRPEIYLPTYNNRITLIVRTAGEPAQSAASVREAVEGLDDRAAINMRTMEAVVDRSTWSRRTLAILMMVLGAVALLLAAMGIYGVTSYLVAQRTREMGIRLALGAQKPDLLKLVLHQGLMMTMAGVACGLVLSFALTRFLSSVLFGVSAADPITFIAIALLLAVVALIASFLPARRAMKIDPIQALRHE